MPRLKSLKLKFAKIARFLRFRDWITFRRPSAFKHETRDYDLWKVINYCGTWRLRCCAPAQMGRLLQSSRIASPVKRNSWDANGKIMAFVDHKSRAIDCKNENAFYDPNFGLGARAFTEKINWIDPQTLEIGNWAHAASRAVRPRKREIALMTSINGRSSEDSHHNYSHKERFDSQPPQILLHLAGDFRWEFRSFSAMNSRARLCWWMINHNSRSTATIHRLFCFAENPHITSLSYESVRKSSLIHKWTRRGISPKISLPHSICSRFSRDHQTSSVGFLKLQFLVMPASGPEKSWKNSAESLKATKKKPKRGLESIFENVSRCLRQLVTQSQPFSVCETTIQHLAMEQTSRWWAWL